MQLRAQFMCEISREGCSKLQRMIIFSVFCRLGHFSQFFGQVKE